MAETNCWEMLQCGKTNECPAYPEKGRSCWEVDHTRCRDAIQGSAAEKLSDCRVLCQFYHKTVLGKG